METYSIPRTHQCLIQMIFIAIGWRRKTCVRNGTIIQVTKICKTCVCSYLSWQCIYTRLSPLEREAPCLPCTPGKRKIIISEKRASRYTYAEQDTKKTRAWWMIQAFCVHVTDNEKVRIRLLKSFVCMYTIFEKYRD